MYNSYNHRQLDLLNIKYPNNLHHQSRYQKKGWYVVFMKYHVY